MSIKPMTSQESWCGKDHVPTLLKAVFRFLSVTKSLEWQVSDPKLPTVVRTYQLWRGYSLDGRLSHVVMVCSWWRCDEHQNELVEDESIRSRQLPRFSIVDAECRSCQTDFACCRPPHIVDAKIMLPMFDVVAVDLCCATLRLLSDHQTGAFARVFYHETSKIPLIIIMQTYHITWGHVQ